MSHRKLITWKTNNNKTCICDIDDEMEIMQPIPELNEFRKLGSLCDGIIHCADGKSIKVHKVILSAVSPFFKNIFHNGQTNVEVNETSVDISSKYLNLLLHYAYFGKCDINKDTVEELLICSDRYEVIGVTKLCCQYLIDSLNTSDCLKTLNFAKEYLCPGLKEKGKMYIKRNFMKILENSEDFNNMCVEDLKGILSDEELNVNCESRVLKIIKSWVEHDREKRKSNVWNLIRDCIYFYKNNAKLLMKELRKWDLLDENQSLLQTMVKKEVGCPRVPHDIIFAIGGWETGFPTHLIETYDIRADKWFVMLDHDKTPRFYHGVCCLEKKIYLVGGFDGNDHYNSVRCFDPITRQWSEKACMNQARCYVSVTVLDKSIYALGGYNGMSRLNTAERYCAVKNQWHVIASMNKHRSDGSAASHCGKVYIVGGIDGRDVLSSGEMYDPLYDQWTYIKPMNVSRSGVCLVSYQNDLYALGGYDGHRRLASCEKLSPLDNTPWKFIPPMNKGRSNFAAVVIEDLIFVIGGFDGYGTVGTVEYFSPKKNSWHHAKSMNYKRSALSGCVVSGLSNARDYGYPRKVLRNLKETNTAENDSD